MSNLLYKRFNELANRLIKKYGYSDVKIARQVKVGNDWENNFETVYHKSPCLILPSQKYSKESFKINTAFDISESNYVAFLPYTKFIPTLNDRIITNLGEYSIVSIVRFNFNGEQEIMFKLELK